MLPQSSEEALLLYEGRVAYAAARTRRTRAERVLLRAMDVRHAQIIIKLFRNAPEGHAELEIFFRECVRLVESRPRASEALSPPAPCMPRERKPPPNLGDTSFCAMGPH